MKHQMQTLMDGYSNDNAEYIAQAEQTVAEHVIATCEATDWNWFFSEEELEKGITAEMIEEVRVWLECNYNYNPPTPINYHSWNYFIALFEQTINPGVQPPGKVEALYESYCKIQTNHEFVVWCEQNGLDRFALLLRPDNLPYPKS